MQEAVSIVRDPLRDDDAKEQAARKASGNLLRQGLEIVLKSAITAAGAALPFWLADALSLKPWRETVAFASRWDVLAITAIVMIGAGLAWRHYTAGRT